MSIDIDGPGCRWSKLFVRGTVEVVRDGKGERMGNIDFDEISQRSVGPYSDGVGKFVGVNGLEISRVEFTKGRGGGAHQHDGYQVVVVVSGRMAPQVGEEHFEVGPGGAWIVPADTEHEARCLSDAVVVSIREIRK